MSRHLSTDGPVLAALARQRWVPVLRCGDVEDAVATARALRSAGCEIVELTYSTPDVEVAVRRLVDEGLVVGVGTVRSPSQVRAAAEAGASFVVSFFRPVGFVAAARDHGVTPVPAGLTPHELAACAEDGAPLVKVFPARVVGPAYLGELRPVLPDVAVMVSGGMPADRAAVDAWIDAGATCVGIGSPLGTVASVGADEVRARATRLAPIADVDV